MRLQIEEYYRHLPPRGTFTHQRDDLGSRHVRMWARKYLAGQGYEQYEISNFSRPGKACKHNLIYWRQEDYLGVGVGAVGCVDGLRWENHKNLHDYHKDFNPSNDCPFASLQKQLDDKILVNSSG